MVTPFVGNVVSFYVIGQNESFPFLSLFKTEELHIRLMFISSFELKKIFTRPKEKMFVNFIIYLLMPVDFLKLRVVFVPQAR